MSPTLVLPRELTIYSVGELRPAWLQWLAATLPEEPGPVDGASVEEVDAAGLQLLLALSNSLAREQHGLQLSHASPVLRAACEALGLHVLLGSEVAA
jgi:anti-anti-sigma regulatory factor